MSRRLVFFRGCVVFSGFFACALARADLVLHYAFETDFTDGSVSGNDGTANGGAAITNAADAVILGTGSLALDGADTSSVSLAAPVTLSSGTAWSVAFWAKRGETGSQKGMVMGNPANNNDFIWLNDQWGGLRFRSTTGATVDFTAPKDRKLHLYALVAGGDGTLSLYIDGALSENQAAADTGFSFTTVGQAYSATAHLGFFGVLDELRVYTSAIDSDAVSALYLEKARPLLHYAFDGGFTDSSENANDGTAGGGLTLTAVTSQVPVGAGALVGDGGDASFVALSNALSFGATEAWSVSFWAQRGEIGGSQGMVMGGRDNNNDFIWLNDAFTGFRFRNSSGGNVEFDTSKDLLRHHYVLAAEGDGTMSLYVDGALSTNKSASNTSFALNSIGQAYATNSLHYAFKGVLDDVRVYGLAVSRAMVAALYREGRVTLLHYAFDGDADDSSASDNDGTLAGNAALTSDPADVAVVSGALTLDGADTSKIGLSSSILFTNGVPWSVAFWARRDELGAGNGMIMGRANTYADFIWLNDSFSGLRFRSSTSNTVDFTVSKDRLMHHYALVADGNGTLRLYVDGAFSASQATSNTSFLIDTIGQAYFTSGHYGFLGVLDDVRVYTYALDSDSVSALFAMGGSQRLHYAFEGNFSDSSPFGNDGSSNGNAALTADDAAVGTNALSLDGASGSYVTLATSITFTNGMPWSAAFWAKRAGNANQGMVMGKRSNTADFIWLTDNFNGFRFRSSSSTTLDLSVTKDLDMHHYALISEGDGTMSLYVDGVFSTNASVATTGFSVDTIGCAYTTSGYEFKGALDDVRVFNYALAATNVATLYTLGGAEPSLPDVTVTHVHVILQGGQSNSEGRADPTQLPASPVDLQGYQDDVDFYYLGSLSTLHPATTSGTQFGPEITCGRHLVDLMQPDASNRVAIIKYSQGGTSLYSDWKAGGDATTTGDGTLYVNFQNMVANGLAALAAAYPEAEITIEGMIWMQGESDVPSASAEYYTNLKSFIADVRLTYALPDLPFIVGRLSASQTGAGDVALLNVVRQAQTDVAAEDAWTGLVDTDGFSLKTDNLHFDASGQQDLGNAFAEQLLYLKGLEGVFTSAEIAVGAMEPEADPDGDGMNNWDEYLAGTDAADSGSVLALTEAPVPAGNTYVVRWSSVAGRVYAVERSTNLSADVFAPIIENLSAAPPLNVYTDTPPASSALFYRVRADRP